MIRRVRLYFLHRRAERLRREWIAAGSPDIGRERAEMMMAFVMEGRVRYSRLLDALAEWESRNEPFKLPDYRYKNFDDDGRAEYGGT